MIVARVGNQPILAGDVLGTINKALEPYKDKIPPEQLDEQRKKLMKQYVEGLISTKLVYLDFLRSVPKEAHPEIEKRLGEQFQKRQLPKLLERYEVKTPAELDRVLRKEGSSVAKQRRLFAEQVVAAQTIREKVNTEPEITHQQMLKEYEKNASKYAIAAQARWEQLTARFDEFPSEQAAYEAVAAMGNEVLGGAPFAEVARRSSQGFTAEDGGQHDWTAKDALKSKVLDEAIFTLPIGRLSHILRDDSGFHIIRVIKRQPASRVPFEEAQVEIKERLQQEIAKKEVAKFLEGLRARTKVWTMFDES